MRENHVFDDYLGNCHSTINASCNDGADYTGQTNYQADVPFLHQWAKSYAVFDNMYSSVDPYSSQAHAYILTANASGSDPLCAGGGVEGTGGSTEWGVYNSTSVQKGYCSFTSDGNDENYNGGGSIFDRFLGPNVTQSATTPPFLTIGDTIWNVASSGCTVSSTTGIPGTLPGNNESVEHLSGCTNGWWYNASTRSPTMPPVLNPTTGIPQELFVCQDFCKTGPSPYLDQDSAYAFLSYVKDYGLPTFTYVRLGDDHPGSLCGSSLPYSTCIQWNDASMNLIVEDIMNSTSAYKDNTVVAISEDDTQDGQNGPDHVNNGRRLPFVMVASHNVMGGKNGLVIHPTFNTSNVLSVMERVEMNVNPSVFDLNGISPSHYAFPMVVNDYLAKGNPLEPLWKCGSPGVPCNTGPSTQVLTTTSVSPDPVNAATGSSVPLTASALDQNGSPISGAIYAWKLTPSSLGSLSPTSGPSVTFTASALPGSGTVCENATYGSKTLTGCAPVSVSATVTLASVSLTPSGNPSVVPSGVLNLTASSTGSNGQNLGGATSYVWNLNTSALGSLNATTGQSVHFTAGSTTGNLTLCVNGTYALSAKMACDRVTISSAAPTLHSVNLTPSRLQAPDGAQRTFYAQAMDQYGNPLTSGITYQWTLNPSSIGAVNPASGSGNTTVFTAQASGWANGTLTVSAINALTTLVTSRSNISVTQPPPALSLPSFTAAPATVSQGGMVYLNATASGGTSPYTYAYSGLPAGCSTADTATLTCHPSATGRFTVTVTVTDAAGSAVMGNASFTVSAGASLTITSFTALPASVTRGGTVDLNVSASGGIVPYTYAYAGLPAGCSSADTATLACIPTLVGSFTVTATVNDSASHTTSGHATFTVVAPVLGISITSFTASPTSIPAGGTSYLNVSATGGSGAYSYVYTGLPGGCLTSNTSSLACAPTVTSGTFTVTVTVTDPSGRAAHAPTSLTVNPSGVSTSAGSQTPWFEIGFLVAIVAVAAAVTVVLVKRRRPKPSPPPSWQPEYIEEQPPMR